MAQRAGLTGPLIQASFSYCLHLDSFEYASSPLLQLLSCQKGEMGVELTGNYQLRLALILLFQKRFSIQVNSVLSLSCRCSINSQMAATTTIDLGKQNTQKRRFQSEGRVGILFDPSFEMHASLEAHSENKGRVCAILKALRKKGLLQHPRVQYISSVDPADDASLSLCYPPAYVQYVRESSALKEQVWADGDTYICEYTFEAACKAVNAAVIAAQKVLSGAWAGAYAVVRPPGHHSGTQDKPSGFCIFNNAAIAAQWALQKGGVKRVCVFDWDVHHGNGTQQLFYKRKDVLFCSMHQFDDGSFYPGQEGDPEKAGAEEGLGFNANLGWNIKEGKVDDRTAVQAFEQFFLPIILEFEPEFIVVSAGFDSHQGDPLGALDYTSQAYRTMTLALAEIAPLILVLQGGYNQDNLATVSLALVETMLGQAKSKSGEKQPKLKPVQKKAELRKEIALSKKIHSSYWKNLN